MSRRVNILRLETPMQMLIKSLLFGLIIGGIAIYAMSKTLKPVPTPATIMEQMNDRQ